MKLTMKRTFVFSCLQYIVVLLAFLPVAHAEAAKTFDVWEFAVDGNTLLDDATVQRSLTPYLGEQRRIEDIEQARATLESVYRDHGYATVLVNIPEQNVDEALVRLQVIEGKVGRFHVTGSRYFALDATREAMVSVSPGAVPRSDDLQAQFVALNRLSADRVATPLMRPGKVPGTVDFEVRVKDSLPLHGAVELNDNRNENGARVRSSVSLRYDNLWQRAHSLGFQYQTTPQQPEQMQVLSGTYIWRRISSPDVLALYGVKSDSKSAAVGDINVIGRGTIAGARYVIPVMTMTNAHTFSLGADYKDFAQNIELAGADTLNTPISYSVFSLAYGGNFRWNDTDSSRLDISSNFGIRGLGNSEEEFATKRFRATPNFFYLRGGLQHTLTSFLGLQWSGSVDGQLTGSGLTPIRPVSVVSVDENTGQPSLVETSGGMPLISNEQYAAGGADSVRGYYSSQVMGDHGVRGSLELRTPNWAPAVGYGLSNLQILTFAEGARLWVQEALGGQQYKFFIASVGGGMRVSAWRGFSANLDVAVPLRDYGSVNANQPRIHFKTEYSF